MSDLTDFVEGLKAHLCEKNYHERFSWLGDTETGFYTEENFDFDKMLKEIDEFSETFKQDNG